MELLAPAESRVYIPMFKSCMICTDFSDGLHRLVNFIPQLAKGGIKQVVFVHSVPLWEEGEIPRVDQEGIQKAQAYLSQALVKVPEQIDVKIEVPSGRPIDTIPRILETYNSEVIITGTPIRSLLQEKIFGSTSKGLAKLVTIPLMTLRPELISTYTDEELSLRCQHLWRYLLIPYNDSESARYLIKRIKEYAQKRPENSLEKCMLCSIVEEGGRRGIPIDYRLQEAQEKLEEAKQELEEVGLQVQIEVKAGNPIQEVLHLALDFDISAIAIGDVGSSNLFEWTKPSFASDLLCRSWFPVLLFSPKR